MTQKFKDLELSDEKIGGGDEQSFDNAPEQGGSFEPPLPEGTYVFELPPAGLLEDAINVSQTDKGQRLYVLFGRDCPLTVTRAKDDPQGELVGKTFRGLLSNRERNRARKGQPESLWSDWDYVLKALGEKSKPLTNMDYIKKLLAHGGESFVADVEYSAYCNSGKVKYVESDEGGNVLDPEGGMGCGRNYYSRDIDVVDGAKVTAFACKNPECGAQLLVNTNLNRIRPLVTE